MLPTHPIAFLLEFFFIFNLIDRTKRNNKIATQKTMRHIVSERMIKFSIIHLFCCFTFIKFLLILMNFIFQIEMMLRDFRMGCYIKAYHNVKFYWDNGKYRKCNKIKRAQGTQLLDNMVEYTIHDTNTW